MDDKAKLYIKKYCEKHNITEDEAVKHIVVQEYLESISEGKDERDQNNHQRLM